MPSARRARRGCRARSGAVDLDDRDVEQDVGVAGRVRRRSGVVRYSRSARFLAAHVLREAVLLGLLRSAPAVSRLVLLGAPRGRVRRPSALAAALQPGSSALTAGRPERACPVACCLPGRSRLTPRPVPRPTPPSASLGALTDTRDAAVAALADLAEPSLRPFRGRSRPGQRPSRCPDTAPSAPSPTFSDRLRPMVSSRRCHPHSSTALPTLSRSSGLRSRVTRTRSSIGVTLLSWPSGAPGPQPPRCSARPCRAAPPHRRRCCSSLRTSAITATCACRSSTSTSISSTLTTGTSIRRSGPPGTSFGVHHRVVGELLPRAPALGRLPAVARVRLARVASPRARSPAALARRAAPRATTAGLRSGLLGHAGFPPF